MSQDANALPSGFRTPGAASALQALRLCAAVVIGGLFVLAALNKLNNPHDFLASIYDYQLLAPPWGRYLAMMLPHVELVLGVAAITGFMRRPALWFLAMLCGVFVLAQLWVVAKGLSVPCACFGGGDESQVGFATLLRTSLVGLAAAGAACCTPSVSARATVTGAGVSLRQGG